MRKWKILALLGFGFGIAGIEWGRAQQKNVPGFYELRIYTAEPGKRDALAARFASRTAGTYARYGITNVGYWIPLESDPELGISAEKHLSISVGTPQKMSATSGSRPRMTIRNSTRSFSSRSGILKRS
jgi:hypothetical protein